MPESPTGMRTNTGLAFTKLFTHDLPCIILSLALFLGGIWLLSLHIPGWSLLFGLIITPIGFAFVVFTLDEVARNVIIPSPFRPVRCNVCGRTTYTRESEEEVICSRCRKDISKKILEEAKI